MALEEYQSKRRFNDTPEPSGKTVKGRGALRFVVQKHQASRLHYDFRLEQEGVLKSWAVPKGPSLDPHERRLAMMVEDHPFDYKDFEGIIPEGNYGAGTVMVWDEGTYAPWAEVKKGDWQEITARAKAEKILGDALAKGHLTFVMHGKKLQGEFALVKIQNAKDENAWLLIKKGDQAAKTDYEVTNQDRSAASGRTMGEIAAAADRSWQSNRGEVDLSDAPKAAMPHDIKPMLATLTEQPFDRPGWLFEIKWDGYRGIVEISDHQVKLYSRNGQSFNEKFAPIVEALKDFGHQAVLDGEVVAVDSDGRSRFQLLQNYQTTGQGNLMYQVFDILFLDGHNLTGLPLKRRKQILEQVLPDSSIIKFSDHVEAKGIDFFGLARQQQLEGMVAKDGDSSYTQGKRSQHWLKVKTAQRQEVVIGGYTEPQGGRKGVGSLLLGVFEGAKLKFVGHSGGSFGGLSPELVLKQLKPLERKTCPFANPPQSNTPQHWVKPVLVAEVDFTEWTTEGSMRHPKLIAWREDKPANEVTKEQPTQNMNSKEQEVKIDGHRLRLTNLNKVFWPDDGFTKGDLINYYRQVAPILLPYLKDRPESLNRHPNGIAGQNFFQKDMRGEAPDWVKTVKIFSDSNQAEIEFLVCQNEATLVHMAQLGCIEINPWNSRVGKLDNPDYTVIDLDPEGIGFEAVIEAAQVTREVLEQAGVEGYPKTSGATGLHIYIPLGAKYDYEQAKQFAQLIGSLVNARLPQITSLERSPAKRQQRIYLDYLQNRHGQTLASAYSVRPRPGATVSTPLNWDEVRPGLDPRQFTIKTILPRLDKVGDLWRPVLGKGIDLRKALDKLSGLAGN